MTTSQKLFCEYYVETYNAVQSYLKAYPNATYDGANARACKVLKKPEVAAYIKVLQEEAIRRWGDVAEVLEKELMDDILKRDEKGNHSPSWQKSVDLLQRQLGLANQKVEVKTDDVIKINIMEEK